MKDNPIPASWPKALPFIYLLAAALTFLALMLGGGAASSLAVFTFPFAQWGLLLSALSRTGPVGGGLAGLLWLLPSALILAYALRLLGKPARRAEMLALLLMAAVIPAALYLMLNPRALLSRFPLMGGNALPLLDAMLGAAAWSCVILYMVLRMAPALRAAGVPRLMVFLFSLVLVMGALLAIGVGQAVYEAVVSLGQPGKSLADHLMALLRLAAYLLTTWMLLRVVFRALRTLELMLSGSEAAPRSVEGLAGVGLMAMKVIAAATVVINLMQLLFSRWLTDISLTASFPVWGLALALAALLFARIYTENRRLEEENRLFV